VSAENSSIDLDSESSSKKSEEEEKTDDDKAATSSDFTKKPSLSDEEAQDLCSWLASTLGSSKVRQVCKKIPYLKLP